MNTTPELEIVLAALADAMAGAPVSSWKSFEYRALVAGLVKLVDPDDSDTPDMRAMYATIGRRALSLLVARIRSSAHAERELARLR